MICIFSIFLSAMKLALLPRRNPEAGFGPRPRSVSSSHRKKALVNRFLRPRFSLAAPGRHGYRPSAGEGVDEVRTVVDAQPLIERVLDDEGLIGDLDEAAAEALVKRLVADIERIAAAADSMAAARAQVADLVRNVRPNS